MSSRRLALLLCLLAPACRSGRERDAPRRDEPSPSPRGVKVLEAFRGAQRLEMGGSREMGEQQPVRVRLQTPGKGQVALEVRPDGPVRRIEVQRYRASGIEPSGGYTSFQCVEPGCSYTEVWRPVARESLVEVTLHPAAPLHLDLSAAPDVDLTR
jgi:hypothetical protein